MNDSMVADDLAIIRGHQGINSYGNDINNHGTETFFQLFVI